MATILVEQMLQQANQKVAVTQITGDIFTAAQLTDDTLRLMAKSGCKSVLNLREDHESGYRDDAELCKELGMEYTHVPLSGPMLMDKDNEALADMFSSRLDAAPKPVVVYCRTAKRAGAVALVYAATRTQLQTETVVEMEEKAGMNLPAAMKDFVLNYIKKKLLRIANLPGISEVTPDLLVGPQPTEMQLAQLAVDGVHSVLNLRAAEEAGQLGLGVLVREKELVEDLGMNYAHVPTSNPATEEQMARIRAAMLSLKPPVLLHCGTKKRATNVQEKLLSTREEGSAGSPMVQCFPHKASATCVYVVWEAGSLKAALIDTASDYDAATGKWSHEHADTVIAFVQQRGLTVEYVLETHVHADHLSAAPYIKSKLGGQVGIGQYISAVQKVFDPIFGVGTHNEEHFDLLLADAASLPLGSLDINIIHTPGHTPACVSYHVGDAVFTGDSLFHPDMGTARCDFPGGSAEQMWHSCQKLLALPASTRNFIGHDYPGTRRDFTCQVSIGEQQSSNKMVKHGTKMEDYVKMRQERDAGLSAPGLLIASIQVNIRGGKMPEPESNGTSYLKVPINKI